jgi:hypothetical protein
VIQPDIQLEKSISHGTLPTRDAPRVEATWKFTEFMFSPISLPGSTAPVPLRGKSTESPENM